MKITKFIASSDSVSPQNMFCIHPPSLARPTCELAAAAGLAENTTALDLIVMAMGWWLGWMEEGRWMERHNLSKPNNTKHPLP